METPEARCFRPHEPMSISSLSFSPDDLQQLVIHREMEKLGTLWSSGEPGAHYYLRSSTATSQGEQHAGLPFRAQYRLTGGKARSNLRRDQLDISRIQSPWRSRYDLLQFIMYLLYDKIVGMPTKTTAPNCQGHTREPMVGQSSK